VNVRLVRYLPYRTDSPLGGDNPFFSLPKREGKNTERKGCKPSESGNCSFRSQVPVRKREIQEELEMPRHIKSRFIKRRYKAVLQKLDARRTAFHGHNGKSHKVLTRINKNKKKEISTITKFSHKNLSKYASVIFFSPPISDLSHICISSIHSMNLLHQD
jgi:hypothetical protein